MSSAINAGGLLENLPKYKCHKEVHALKIASVEFDWEVAKREGDRETDGSATFTFAEGFSPFKVTPLYVTKHLRGLDKTEIVGGYIVFYEDGYQSFSPAKAFEDGYTRV